MDLEKLLAFIVKAKKKGLISPSEAEPLFSKLSGADVARAQRLVRHPANKPRLAAIRRLEIRLLKFFEAEAVGKAHQIVAIGKADPIFAEHHIGEALKAGNLVFNPPHSTHIEVYA